MTSAVALLEAGYSVTVKADRLAPNITSSVAAGLWYPYAAGGSNIPKLAIDTLRRHGVDPGEPVSESWDAYANEAFDYVVTVCDSAAAETCPAFPGGYRKLHWSTPDPARAEGTEAEIDAAFEEAYRMLKERIEAELL